jgi:hypothetical protein
VFAVRRKTESRNDGWAALSATLLAAAVPLVAQPQITLSSNGGTSAAIWYLGPGQTGVVPNGYWTYQGVQASYPGHNNPQPQITWSTNHPELLQLIPNIFVANTSFYTIQALGPSYGYPQLVPPNYNISVIVTWDGVSSAPFKVFSNMPYANYTVNQGQYCSSPGQCDCNAQGFYPGQTGYVTLINVYTQDLFGNFLTPVGTNEVLFHQLYLGTGGWTSSLGNPSQSKWATSAWNSQYTFPDYFWICSSKPSSLSPPPTSYGSGGTKIFSETQNYYIRSAATNGERSALRQALLTSTQSTAFNQTFNPLRTRLQYAQTRHHLIQCLRKETL